MKAPLTPAITRLPDALCSFLLSFVAFVNNLGLRRREKIEAGSWQVSGLSLC